MCSTGAAEADLLWLLQVSRGGPVNTGIRRNGTLGGRAMNDLEHDIALIRSCAAATAVVENRT
jgi:hypothetical protein